MLLQNNFVFKRLSCSFKHVKSWVRNVLLPGPLANFGLTQLPLRITPEIPQNKPIATPQHTNRPLLDRQVDARCQEQLPLVPSSSLHLLARYAPLHTPPPHRKANITQLADVTKAIKSIISDGNVETELAPAYEKYNEEQFTTTKLPGGSTEILVSPYNSLGDGRYYDVETQSSFDFDHATQKASAVQSYVVESQHEDLV